MHPSMMPNMYNRQMNPNSMQYPRGGHPMNQAYNQQNPMNMHNQSMMTNMNNVPGNHYRMVRLFSLPQRKKDFLKIKGINRD